jgi:hypothetical protein
MRPPDARYLHEQNAFKQPGARATAGYSALVRRSGQLFRSKEKFVRLNIGTRAAGEICFPPGNAENRNPELARQAAAGLRFFVAGKKLQRSRWQELQGRRRNDSLGGKLGPPKDNKTSGLKFPFPWYYGCIYRKTSQGLVIVPLDGSMRRLSR